MDEKRHEDLNDEENGMIAVHQHITEAYQSGVVDARTYEKSRNDVDRIKAR